MKKVVLLAVAVMLCGGTAVRAQDWIVDKLRSDLRAERTAIIEEEMQFSEDEAAAFWPVFNKYEAEIRAINDQRVKLITKYADNYDSMTDDIAEALAKKSLDLDIKEAYTRKKYFREFNHVLPATRAVKFYQIDGLLDLLVRAQVASSLPFVEKAGSVR
jgi:hypothetical protein